MTKNGAWRNLVTYIIGKNCIDVLDGACVDVCPVDCIYSKPGDRQLFINPEECIDCAACDPVCPVDAIYAEEEVPGDQEEFVKLNYEYDYATSSPGMNTSRMRASVFRWLVVAPALPSLC